MRVLCPLFFIRSYGFDSRSAMSRSASLLGNDHGHIGTEQFVESNLSIVIGPRRGTYEVSYLMKPCTRNLERHVGRTLVIIFNGPHHVQLLWFAELFHSSSWMSLGYIYSVQYTNTIFVSSSLLIVESSIVVILLPTRVAIEITVMGFLELYRLSISISFMLPASLPVRCPFPGSWHENSKGLFLHVNYFAEDSGKAIL